MHIFALSSFVISFLAHNGDEKYETRWAEQAGSHAIRFHLNCRSWLEGKMASVC